MRSHKIALGLILLASVAILVRTYSNMYANEATIIYSPECSLLKIHTKKLKDFSLYNTLSATESAFDARILEINDGLWLHQTWKSKCIPASKVMPVSSWPRVDPTIRIAFWDDNGISLWINERFKGTKIHTVWKWLSDMPGKHAYSFG